MARNLASAPFHAKLEYAMRLRRACKISFMNGIEIL